ncbi:2Fe-2S iron-sulfur cluster-binding protein [Cohnella sp. AR92]|uniref:2Fe-2S iron-sulfur cluster-binding protein n=1 Tax=Cohnella sp. AR92 TaxID=648716 RepID=UPI000F8EA9E9|nr:2Fe-2S iron-sulfur cluster-binding protein [Cohnella sp. AR92]RUS48163.1 2Fe-2S iron-sulfur cluster binding domain-containing protein [Cohnella sp. AR92]
MATAGSCKVTFLPDNRTITVRPGISLLEASRKANVAVRTRCGGVAGCLMCKVHVDEDCATRLSVPTVQEQRKLGTLLENGTRLSCQAKVRGDVVVTVPEDPLKAAIRRRLAEQAEEDLW